MYSYDMTAMVISPPMFSFIQPKFFTQMILDPLFENINLNHDSNYMVHFMTTQCDHILIWKELVLMFLDIEYENLNIDI